MAVNPPSSNSIASPLPCVNFDDANVGADAARERSMQQRSRIVVRGTGAAVEHLWCPGSDLRERDTGDPTDHRLRIQVTKCRTFQRIEGMNLAERRQQHKGESVVETAGGHGGQFPWWQHSDTGICHFVQHGAEHAVTGNRTTFWPHEVWGRATNPGAPRQV